MFDPATLSIIGLVWPTVSQTIKSLFGKKSSLTKETIGALASTKPEVLADYVRANNETVEFNIKWFNRDVGTGVHPWVVTWRAAIRPLVVTCSISALLVMYFLPDEFDLVSKAAANTDITAVLSFYVSSWMGSRPYEKG